MNKKALIGGIVLALSAMIPTVGAYHLTCVPTALGTSACTWDNTAGTGLLIVICESDGPLDPINDAPESHGGIGGLCYMDSEYATPGGYPPVAADAPASTVWGEVMPTGGVGGFFIRVGNNAHSCVGVFGFGAGAADEFQYIELIAFWTTNGHVSLFVDEPLTAGSYTGTPYLSDPGTGYCNALETVAIV